MIRNLLHVQQFALLFQQLLWQLCRACNQTQYNRGAIKMMFVVPKVKPKVLLFSRLFYRVVQQIHSDVSDKSFFLLELNNSSTFLSHDSVWPSSGRRILLPRRRGSRSSGVELRILQTAESHVPEGIAVTSPNFTFDTVQCGASWRDVDMLKRKAVVKMSTGSHLLYCAFCSVLDCQGLIHMCLFQKCKYNCQEGVFRLDNLLLR